MCLGDPRNTTTHRTYNLWVLHGWCCSAGRIDKPFRDPKKQFLKIERQTEHPAFCYIFFSENAGWVAGYHVWSPQNAGWVAG